MKKFVALALLATACGAPTETVVDGARVGVDGWPVRPAAEQFRCPDGTFITDEMVGERRRVTCRTRLNPAPRGFELAWHANEQLATRRVFDENGRVASVVEFDDTGRKIAEEQWTDGVRMVSTSWYPNGERRSEKVFVAETQATNVTQWAPDGSIEARGTIRNGVREGTWTEWVDGAQESAEYVGGVRSGSVTRTYPDKSIETGTYAAGKRDGTWRRNDPSGAPLKVARYSNGVLDGAWRAWHPNQQPKAEGNYSFGQKHGEWVYWRPSGEIAARETFKCGRPHGLVRRFHPNGQPELTGVFWDGQKVGEWQNWNSSGDLTQIDEYGVVEGLDDLQGLQSGSRQPALPKSCFENDRATD